MLQIDSALDGPWEHIGQLLTASGNEDASGARRYIAQRLAQRDYEPVERTLHIGREQAEECREMFVREFGEPENGD